MNAFILAGGQSTRMGRDKALLEVDGETLVERALGLLRGLGLAPRICGSRLDLAHFADVVPDNFPLCGPLGGIEAALAVSDTELNLFVPVDLPGLPGDFLRWLMARAETGQAVATIPKYGGRLQPLCAVYRPQFADAAENSLRSGHYKIDALFAAPHTRIVAEKELESAGFSSSMFRNLNTPGELEAVRNESGGGRNN